MRNLHLESLILSRKESELKAPKTIECIAPIRAQASIAIANSGIICIYKQTLSPFLAPNDFNTLENLFTSLSNSL